MAYTGERYFYYHDIAEDIVAEDASDDDDEDLILEEIVDEALESESEHDEVDADEDEESEYDNNVEGEHIDVDLIAENIINEVGDEGHDDNYVTGDELPDELIDIAEEESSDWDYNSDYARYDIVINGDVFMHTVSGYENKDLAIALWAAHGIEAIPIRRFDLQDLKRKAKRWNVPWYLQDADLLLNGDGDEAVTAEDMEDESELAEYS